MKRTPRFDAVARALVLGLAVPVAASAQEAEARAPRGPQWDAITMFHGMPSRNVRAIAQDREGLLWFGTDAGLVRYDGQRLERVALDPGSVPVLALAADERAQLWIGTEQGAFVRALQGTRAVPGTAGQAITAVLVAGQTVRLASRSGQLFTSDADARRVDRIDAATANLLRGPDGARLELAALALDGGRAVVGSRGRGLLRVDGAAITEVEDPLRPFFVNALSPSRSGLVLGAETSASGRGLFRLQGHRLEVLDVKTGSVLALASGPGDDTWAGTRDHGLVRLRPGRPSESFSLESTAGGLHSNRVQAVLVDRDGVVWVGTDRGICRYDPNAPRVVRFGASPDSSFVHALRATADGRLWAATQRGLFVQRDAAGPWEPVPALAGRAVHSLGAAPDGRLLAGCAAGLLAQAPAGDAWEAVRSPAPHEGGAPDASASVRAIETWGDTVYLATYGQGLERLEEGQRVRVWPEVDDPRLREVVSLAAVGDALWIGTAEAGTFVRSADRTARDEALSSLGTLRAAAADGRGGFWIATSRGLFRRSGGRTRAVAEGEDVRALAPSTAPGSSVWCATLQSGLLNVADDGETGILRARVDSEYGLPSDSVFAMLATDDGLVLGTNRGLVLYDPGHGAPSARLVRVLGRRPYASEEWAALRLDYPENGLLVQAAAIGSRTYPERFQYAFRLEDGAGRVVARELSRDGQFSAEALPPGRYVVSVRAFGTNLAASTPVSLSFTVAGAPVPWPSIALAALLACALLALAWGALQYRRLRTASAALSETRLQLVQETENERRRIARDLHDQTLADLRGLLISLPAAGTEAANLRGDVETISSEVRRICEDLSPSVLANVGLTAALEWALDETIRRQPKDQSLRGAFTCGDDVADRLSLAPAAEIQIYRIVQEALTNAARHAGARSLHLSIALDSAGAAEFVVEDDGTGFDPAAAHEGRGLSNIRSRASLIHAHVEWRRRDGGGTRFVLRVG